MPRFMQQSGLLYLNQLNDNIVRCFRYDFAILKYIITAKQQFTVVFERYVYS